MMEDKNKEVYERVRSVPDEAKKEIKAGRIKGFTDINPMWRIKMLTEVFGICGIGWKYSIKRMWIEESSNEIKTANVEIELSVKHNGEWSEPIPGIGGSMFVNLEKNGLYTSDECYKMALTDAISVSCKALGFGADVYWSADATKYDDPPNELTPEQITEIQKQEVYNYAVNHQEWLHKVLSTFSVGCLDDLTNSQITGAYKSVLKNKANEAG